MPGTHSTGQAKDKQKHANPMQITADVNGASTSYGIPANGIPSAAAARAGSHHSNLPPAVLDLLAPFAQQQLKQAVQQLLSSRSRSKEPAQLISLGPGDKVLLPTVQETLHAQGAATAVSPLRGANIARLLRSCAGSLAASAPSGAASKQAASIPLHSTPSSAAEKQQEIEQRIRNSLAAALQNLQTPASPARLASAAAAPGGSPAGKAAGEKRRRSPSPETEADQLLQLQLLPPGGFSASGVAAAGDAAAMAAGPQPWDMADAGALMNTASELFGACQVRRKSRHRPLTTQQASAGDRRVISGLRCPTALLDVLHCVFAAAWCCRMSLDWRRLWHLHQPSSHEWRQC